MKAEIEVIFRTYLAAHDEKWNARTHWVMHECDVCRYSDDPVATRNWVKGGGQHQGFSSLPPDLCHEHARELGLVW